jgi:hypothetical protein
MSGSLSSITAACVDIVPTAGREGGEGSKIDYENNLGGRMSSVAPHELDWRLRRVSVHLAVQKYLRRVFRIV